MICAKPGSVQVLDRGKLEAMAGGVYGKLEAEHRRLFGTPSERQAEQTDGCGVSGA